MPNDEEARPPVSEAEGIRILADFSVAETKMVWDRYSALLAANAIVAAGLSILLTTGLNPVSKLFAIGASASLGLVIAVSWLRVTHLGWSNSEHFQKGLMQRLRAKPPQARGHIFTWSLVPIWAFVVVYGCILVLALVTALQNR